MKKHTHKITKELQDRIYLVASTLPPMAQMRNGEAVYKEVIVPGTKVKKEDLKPGTPLIPTANYKINQLQYVNHAMMMIELVQRDGPEAIESYQADIAAMVEMTKQEAKRINSLYNKIKTWISKKLNR